MVQFLYRTRQAFQSLGRRPLEMCIRTNAPLHLCLLLRSYQFLPTRNKIDERGQNTVLFFFLENINVCPYLIHSHGSKDLKHARMDFQSSVRYDTNYDFLPSFRTPHLALRSTAQMSDVLYNGVHSLQKKLIILVVHSLEKKRNFYAQPYRTSLLFTAQMQLAVLTMTINSSVCLFNKYGRSVYLSFTKSLGSQVTAVYRIWVNSSPVEYLTFRNNLSGTGQSRTKLP